MKYIIIISLIFYLVTYKYNKFIRKTKNKLF